MSLLVVQLLSGLANAMFLFLIASGLSLIFGVTRIVNFAHGSFYMLAAYLTYSLSALLPLGAGAFYAAALLAALLVAALGGLVETLLLRRVYRAPELYQLLLTFALVLIVADAVRYLWGADNKTGAAAPRSGPAAALPPPGRRIVGGRSRPSVGSASASGPRWPGGPARCGEDGSSRRRRSALPEL